MSWIEIKLDIPVIELEKISAYLFAQGCEGINVTDDEIIMYFNIHRWSDEIKRGLIEYIQHFVPGFGHKNFKITSLSEHDWMSDWKKYFRPLKLGRRMIVKPPWEEYFAGRDDIVITIDPKMAFGTGHHESTQLAIIELEKCLKPGINVLDVGTGSGILAIIAQKLGAGSVFGVDNDPEAIKNAFENAVLNEISGNIQFSVAELGHVTPFEYDLVVANINRNVLIEYAPNFQDYLLPGGHIILSGILRSDEAVITSAYNENGFHVVRQNILRDWLALVLELKDKRSEKSSD